MWNHFNCSATAYFIYSILLWASRLHQNVDSHFECTDWSVYYITYIVLGSNFVFYFTVTAFSLTKLSGFNNDIKLMILVCFCLKWNQSERLSGNLTQINILCQLTPQKTSASLCGLLLNFAHTSPPTPPFFLLVPEHSPPPLLPSLPPFTVPLCECILVILWCKVELDEDGAKPRRENSTKQLLMSFNHHPLISLPQDLQVHSLKFFSDFRYR